MKKHFLAFVFLLFAAGSAHAADYHYVDPAIISPEFIDPPVAEKSPEWLQFDAEIKKIQAKAKPEEIAAAQNESELRPELVADSIGVKLDDPHFSKTAILLNNAAADCKAVISQAKDYWHTARPYLADKDIKALVKPAANNSYPSGHTACSRVYAEILADLAPDQRKKLRARADEIGEHRVLAGMHWPFDLTGGREMAWLFFGALQQSSAYRDDLKAARAEWKQ